MIHVLEYSPKEGERGDNISARLDFNNNSSKAVYLRLLVDAKPLSTKVHELPDVAYGKWQLDATAPAFDPSVGSDKVLLTVQALDDDNQVLDSVTFGDFAYGITSKKLASNAHKRYSSIDSELGGSGQIRSPVGRRRTNTIATATPVAIKPESTTSRGLKREGIRRVRANSLMRAKYPLCKNIDADLYPQTPILELVTPVGDMCATWDAAEQRAGRRLVRFAKVQDGCKLIVSCEPVSPEDYQESESVISCIYHEETKSYCVTSVDIIYLLERLTDDEFPVEEKNRIRRNLEGLRPTTVSKNKYRNFFHRIMEFPDPKPRNIEKDLKVFKWLLLDQALQKILSKYHVYTPSPTDSTVSLPVEHSDDAPPYTIDHQVVHSPKSGEYPELVHSTLKSEPMYDDRSLLFLPSHHDGVEQFSYPTTPLLFSTDKVRDLPENGDRPLDDVLNGNWTPPERMPTGDLGIGDYGHLADFHLADPGEPPQILSSGDGHDYESYSSPTYSFPGIIERSLTPYY